MEKKDLIAKATQKKFDEDLIAKAKQANSIEELMALAKENGYPMDEKEAEFYFKKLHKTGELSDDELDNVAGGGCRPNRCQFCGGDLDAAQTNCSLKNLTCPYCGQWEYSG